MTAPTPPDAPKRSPLRHIRPSDLTAAAQLATTATHGVIDLTESVHQSVRRRLGLPAGAAEEQTGGLTGRVYQAVRGVTRLVGWGTDAVLTAVLPLLDDPASHPEASPQREAVLAALNGVLGDRLLAMRSPLAQAMELRANGAPLTLTTDALRVQLPQASSHLLLLVHGLCMNDTQWRRNGHDHGAHLAPALGATPVYLRYNSGLHTSVNGRELALLLGRLAAHWPVPLERITVIGHSMGGLLARSAFDIAQQAGQHWPARLQDLVFLGTPQHGAPLERAGHGIDLLLASNPYSRPFVHLARLRSAGITDLRHGHVRESDWRAPDRRAAPVPLPAGVACYAVAAALAERHCGLADRLLGDGLVPLNSALGRHDTPARGLAFPPAHCHVAWQLGHLALLGDAAVADRLVQWLGAN